MASSEQDRRLVLALSGAAIEVEAQPFKDPTAQAIVAIAVPLMRDAAAALDRAVEVEDKEDIEAERAGDARRKAFDELTEAFRRMYAGLTVGVGLATLRGEQSDGLSDLRAYLDETNPSTFRARSLGNALAAIRIARTFGDQFVPATERKALFAYVDAAIDAARTAEDTARKEKGEATAALTALLETRDRARDAYLVGRDLLRGALRLDGRADRLNAIMPTYDSARRGAVGPSTVPDFTDDEPLPDDV